jgi:hypothetical protein
VVFAAIEQERLREIAKFSVDAGAEALLVKLVEEVFELAFAAADDGRHHGDTLSVSEFKNAGNNLFDGLAGYGASAVGTVGSAH